MQQHQSSEQRKTPRQFLQCAQCGLKSSSVTAYKRVPHTFEHFQFCGDACFHEYGDYISGPKQSGFHEKASFGIVKNELKKFSFIPPFTCSYCGSCSSFLLPVCVDTTNSGVDVNQVEFFCLNNTCHQSYIDYVKSTEIAPAAIPFAFAEHSVRFSHILDQNKRNTAQKRTQREEIFAGFSKRRQQEKNEWVEKSASLEKEYPGDLFRPGQCCSCALCLEARKARNITSVNSLKRLHQKLIAQQQQQQQEQEQEEEHQQREQSGGGEELSSDEKKGEHDLEADGGEEEEQSGDVLDTILDRIFQEEDTSVGSSSATTVVVCGCCNLPGHRGKHTARKCTCVTSGLDSASGTNNGI